MYHRSDDTIAAIATPLGHGGLGIIRISGEKALAITALVFKSGSQKPVSSFSSHTLHHGFVYDTDKLIDEVVVSFYKSPHSYTGEDVIEISAHGGPVIVKEILSLCCRQGARLAMPGEFTFRAFLNKRLDLTRAEAVADLITSKTERAARASINQLEGSLAEKIHAWRAKLLDLLTLLEAAIDHPDEDIPVLSKSDVRGRLLNLKEHINPIIRSAAKSSLLRDGLKVAIIGRPNAGKSSLLNALLERDRAIVTEFPGTTRDVLEETLDLGGIPLVVMDTAGLRSATTDPIEKIGHERTRRCMHTADMILWVLDASQPFTPADEYIASLLSSVRDTAQVIAVFNKIDLPVVMKKQDVAAYCCFENSVELSAVTTQGVATLEDAILTWLKNTHTLFEESFLVNERHVSILKRVESALQRSIEAVAQGEPDEVTALTVRETIDTLGEITGETVTEEILDAIFSRFCIGK